MWELFGEYGIRTNYPNSEIAAGFDKNINRETDPNRIKVLTTKITAI